MRLLFLLVRSFIHWIAEGTIWILSTLVKLERSILPSFSSRQMLKRDYVKVLTITSASSSYRHRFVWPTSKKCLHQDWLLLVLMVVYADLLLSLTLCIKSTIYFKTEFNNPSNYIPQNDRKILLCITLKTHFILKTVWIIKHQSGRRDVKRNAIQTGKRPLLAGSALTLSAKCHSMMKKILSDILDLCKNIPKYTE